jgi:putative ABC transport system substrate-binding protein
MQFDLLRRREFIAFLGGAVAWPLAARAQQPMPVIGFLSAGSAQGYAEAAAAFRQGLEEVGYREGQNVAIEYRWADGQYDRLPALAADLVLRQVAVTAASGGTVSVLAAKAATKTIPIVFVTGSDPVAAGLVASLNRPGGNVTGVNFFATEAGTKQLGLLRELVPAARKIALLVNPKIPLSDTLVKDVQTAVQSLGLQLLVLHASTERDIDDIFTGLSQQRPDVLLVQTEPFLGNHKGQIASLALRQAIPAIAGSAFAAAGGLISYGASGSDAYHQAGLYVGRILKGENPADLPVMQSTKFELVINLKTAKALGITVPPNLLAIADEVIE